MPSIIGRIFCGDFVASNERESLVGSYNKLEFALPITPVRVSSAMCHRQLENKYCKLQALVAITVKPL